ncbi:AraC family transcriptional regulator [Bacteroidota bacterium]
MKYIRHTIVVPESHSFVVNKLDLSNNAEIIHSHKNFELNFIIRGRGRRFVGGNISFFKPGDLVFLGPDLPHGWEVENPEDQPLSFTIHFNEDLFDATLFQIPEFESLQKLLERSRHGIYFSGISPEVIQEYLETLKDLQGFDAVMKILQILRFLTQIKNTYLLSNFNETWIGNEPETVRINKVYDYVFQNFQEGIKLNDVAGLLNLSESAFCTYFKKLTKKSFFTFLTEVKIGYACKLLLADQDNNIAQICYNSGFNNLSNFNRQFRKITNMNPREYRIKYAGNPILHF